MQAVMETVFDDVIYLLLYSQALSYCEKQTKTPCYYFLESWR